MNYREKKSTLKILKFTPAFVGAAGRSHPSTGLFKASLLAKEPFKLTKHAHVFEKSGLRNHNRVWGAEANALHPPPISRSVHVALTIK